MTATHRMQATIPNDPRILYLMHVDWRWIKQRPHFLAEALMTHYELLVMDRKCIVPGIQLTANRTRLRRRSLLPIPWKWRATRWCSVRAQRAWVRCVAGRFKPTAIWVTHP